MGQLFSNEKIAFTNNCRVLTKCERVILANRDSGLWIKISRQCYDILNKAIENNLTQKDLINNILEKGDKEYFLILLERLNELGVLNFGEQKEFLDSRLEQIYFSLTHRCNLNCIHCSVDAKSSLENDFLTTEEVISIINKIIACNPQNITFTGGEPLFRKDILEILKYTSQKYTGVISLMTNGTLINEENVKDLISYVQNIDMSIDGIDEETCSLVRGKGVYNKVIESVKLLQKHGFTKISLSMVFGQNNYHLKDEFFNQNKILGTKAVPRIFTATGRGQISKYVFRDKEGSNGKGKSTNNSDNSPIELSKKIRACSCGAGRKEIVVNYDGFIYPCVLLTKDEYKICNARDVESINDFFANTRLGELCAYRNLNAIQPDIHERCKDCYVNMFCWPCLNELDLIKNDDNTFYERCGYMKETLNRIVWEV